MAKTDFRKLMDKPYLGAWDIPENNDLVVTIDRVAQEEVKGESGRTDMCMVIHFKETKKPMICNITNAKNIAKIAGSKFIEDWSGVRIALYATEVQFGRSMVDAIRVREYAPKLPEKVVCADCGKEIVAHDKYTAKAIAESTRGKFGRPLCYECGEKAQAEAEQKAKESDIL